ncbi:MAG: hypothetical protein LBJ46_09330 [Planctomycetota bacterium]|nr:hypothetical protein [Planctomycetota bacterium]
MAGPSRTPKVDASPARVTVKVKLPPVGQTGPSRLRMVEVAEDGDGILDFHSPTAVAEPRESGIPGLMTPELLAMDQTLLTDTDYVSLSGLALQHGADTGGKAKNEAAGYWPTIFLPPDLSLMTPGADTVFLDNIPPESRHYRESPFLPLPTLSETEAAEFGASPISVTTSVAQISPTPSAKWLEDDLENAVHVPISSLRPPQSGAVASTGDLFNWPPTPSERTAATPDINDASGETSGPRPPEARNRDESTAGAPLFAPSLLTPRPRGAIQQRPAPPMRIPPPHPLTPAPTVHNTALFGNGVGLSQRGRHPRKTSPMAEVMMTPKNFTLLPRVDPVPETESNVRLGNTPRRQTADRRSERRAGIYPPKSAQGPLRQAPETSGPIMPVYAMPSLTPRIIGR